MKKLILLSSLLIAFSMGMFAQQPRTNYVEATDKHDCIYLTKAEFIKRVANYEKNPKQWIYLGDKPCIVDFFTTWCGPCKRLAPVLEDLAKQYKGKIYIYKVDAEKEAELSAAFGIRSYPSLLFCPQTGTPQMALGALPKEDLVKLIDQILLGQKPENIAKADTTRQDSTKKATKTASSKKKKANPTTAKN